MDLVVSIFFFIFAFICMIYALYEERDTNDVDDSEETKSDNLIIILMGASVVLFFVSMACMLAASTTYYSAATDSLITVHLKEYEPLSYVPLGFALFAIILVAAKAFQMIDRARNEP